MPYCSLVQSMKYRTDDIMPPPIVKLAEAAKRFIKSPGFLNLGQARFEVERFEMTGTTLNLRGRATDAAAVMKRLIDEPSYVEVDAPRAISRVRGTDLEQFYLQITLSAENQPGEMR